MIDKKKQITVAIDGLGGDRGIGTVIGAMRFALALYPNLRLLVFGNNELLEGIEKQKIDSSRYVFYKNSLMVPQDASVKDVMSVYLNSSMAQAIQSVMNKEADAVVSNGGTGPLVCLARHFLKQNTPYHPALAARMPTGPNSCSLMLDLGANAETQEKDLLGFAKLGAIAYQAQFNATNPTVALLNVGTEQGKGSKVIQRARELIVEDKTINFTGFIEANSIFRGNVDVIVSDGFTGNIALKAAEGVASLFANASGIRKFFARMARPDWLLPWQFNGSILLGVNGIVIKSHASAGNEALAVAMVEAARYSQSSIIEDLNKAFN